MEDQFVPYNLSLKLKELGFDEQTFAGYDGGDYLTMPSNKRWRWVEDFGYKKYTHQNKHIVKAPLWQQVFDWFKENKGLFRVIDITIESKYFYSVYNLKDKRNAEIPPKEEIYFETYEEARQACLKKLIKIIENGKA